MKPSQQATVARLNSLLSTREDLKEALYISIQAAGFEDIRTLEQYYAFLNGVLTKIPTQRDMGPDTDKFHFLISHSPGNMLKRDAAFNHWLREFSRDLGAYLDTTCSAAALDTFINNPEYRIEEYDRGPSGWLTFNQFFARRARPGLRPIDDPYNDRVIVAATDSVFLGVWPVTGDSAIIAKGISYNLAELLRGSPYAGQFKGGQFTHAYLDTTDYHRFHVPVRGTVKDVRVTPGKVFVDTVQQSDGTFKTLDEVGFQFSQTRGLIIIDSPVGLVAALPIGMGHVSSVNISAQVNVYLTKGEEFGYFCYGGSDMILIFQEGKVEFTAEPGTHYKQGQRIGRSIA